jgi:large subunit ribosomal protein L13
VAALVRAMTTNDDIEGTGNPPVDETDASEAKTGGHANPRHALTRQTIAVKPSDVDRQWFVVDATNQPLGRLASKIATILRGKHRPTYTPNADNGDFVVVVNAEKVLVTGQKRQQMKYYRHSTIPGGLKERTFEQMIGKKPAFPIEEAVRGMLPKTKLGRRLRSKLKVYAGPTHPHAAQKPEPLAL